MGPEAEASARTSMARSRRAVASRTERRRDSSMSSTHVGITSCADGIGEAEADPAAHRSAVTHDVEAVDPHASGRGGRPAR